MSEFILIGPWNVAVDKLEIVSIDAIITHENEDKSEYSTYDIILRSGNVITIGDFDKFSEAMASRNDVFDDLEIPTGEDDEDKDTISEGKRVIIFSHKTLQEQWEEDRLKLFPEEEDPADMPPADVNDPDTSDKPEILFPKKNIFEPEVDESTPEYLKPLEIN